eukprot:6248231-Ditylum_brightwellii.AAC.1
MTMRENKYHGEILTQIKDEDTLNVYFHNINGGMKRDGWSKYGFAVRKLRKMEVDIIGLAETNIPWTADEIHKARTKMKEDYNGKSKIQTTASDDPVALDYQPGGAYTV